MDRSFHLLTPQLLGYEGKRVEVQRKDGQVSRFIVGRSTGITPVHLEISRRGALGGYPAEPEYARVTEVNKSGKLCGH